MPLTITRQWQQAVIGSAMPETMNNPISVQSQVNVSMTFVAILADALLEMLIAEHVREAGSFSAPDSQNTLDIVEKPSVHPPVRNRNRLKNGPENQGG